MNIEETSTFADKRAAQASSSPIPGVLLARTADGIAAEDYCAVDGELVIGRRQAPLGLWDRSISREHLRIRREGDVCIVEDLGSKNGTFVNGRPVMGPTPLDEQAVIRLGRTLLVYHKDIGGFREDRKYADFQGMVGRFHSVKLALELAECAISKRSAVLIAGPTGTGKELAARAFAAILEREMLVQNSARFATEEEATSSLFGVKARVFSSVEAREGYIEQADKGVLFLDEAHTLPTKVQKSLLRIIEDGALARVGETRPRKVDVKFVLASNEPGPTYGLAHDLLARLRVVEVPPLRKRRADIPRIFDAVLKEALENAEVEANHVVPHISVLHHQSLMLDGLERDNVRGLVAIADRIATRTVMSQNPEVAIADAFAEIDIAEEAPLPSQAKSRQAEAKPQATPATENQKASRATEIEEIVRKLHLSHLGNVTAMERELHKMGIPFSRRKISQLLDGMGLKRLRKPRGQS